MNSHQMSTNADEEEVKGTEECAAMLKYLRTRTILKSMTVTSTEKNMQEGRKTGRGRKRRENGRGSDIGGEDGEIGGRGTNRAKFRLRGEGRGEKRMGRSLSGKRSRTSIRQRSLRNASPGVSPYRSLTDTFDVFLR